MKKNALRIILMTGKYTLIGFLIQFASFNLLLGKNASAQLDVPVHTSLNGKSIKEIFEIIEEKTAFQFIYDANQVDVNEKVKIPGTDNTVKAVFDKLSYDHYLAFKIIGNSVTVVKSRVHRKRKAVKVPFQRSKHAPAAVINPALTRLRPSVPKQISVSGAVTDEHGEPLPGVSVLVKESSLGTSTDLEGRYTLEIPSGNAVLVFTFVGYKSQEVTVGGQPEINVQLEQDLANLEEVVVVGYGTQQRKDVTGAVSVVNVDDMKQQPAASPIEALQGKATGVQVINNGAPGATPQIRIRGFSTINNNDPLYIIDGMPYEGKLGWLNTNDIENIQVLKDASAASIYGARANNGVVIITTRGGTRGTPQVTLDSYYGTQRPNRNRFPEFLNPQQYGEYIYDRFRNAGQTPGTSSTTGTVYGSDPDHPTLPEYLLAGNQTGHNVTEEDADPSNYNYSMDPDQYYQITRANQAGTDWFDVITQNAPMQNHQLSVLGGGENATYALTGGFFKQDGTFQHTGFERYNIRSNTRFTLLNDRLTLGENMQYSFTSGNGFGVNENTSGSYQGEDSPIGWAYRIQTIIPVYDIMGNFAGTRGDRLGNAHNPLAVLYRGKDDINRSGQFFGSAFADFKLVEGLNIRSTFGLRYENFNGKSIGYPFPERSEGSFTNNTLGEYQGYNSEWTWSNTATYKTTFNGSHDFTLLLGTEAVQNRYHQVDGTGNDFFITGDLNYYYLNTAAVTSAESQGAESALFSVFGRVDYSFDDRYLVSATVRRDGSSNFGPENRYGVFPAGSLAWRVSNENFMAPVSWVDDLKLRAGYGVTGNQRIPTFQFLRRFASGVNQSFYPIAGGSELASGIWTSNYDNQDVKWEELKSVNVGLDFALFDGKIDGAIDWFDRKTEGVLYPVPLPAAAVGLGASPFVNSGDIQNTGFELSVNYHYASAVGEDAFRFDIGAFFSSYSNNIVQLAPTVTEQPYLTLRGVTTSVLKADAPLGAFYGYQVDGIYQNEEDIANSPSYDGARVGGFKFADISGPEGVPDGVIDGQDRTVIGNPHPDFIYSLSLDIAYKRFDVSMFFNGSQGNELFDLTRQYTDFYAFPGAVSTRTLDAWSPDNPGSMMPSPHANAPTIEYQSSSYYVQDGSFFRMKNLQVGYNFPVEHILNGNISSLRLYASATNLFTITSYSGLDPEVSQYSSDFTAPGVDMGVYPVPRQYLLGLSVTF